ncbi:hypothetical protein SDRG_11556 [Saprolegnia diclina VS20]|uniref:Uncharacterized protein n=1 Tax=Saprolegnia diclina (strain VS20) TaxID=1156394 RepID=T0QB84_SAPDV|nr:hypothetical protein SDRG_11556 [Saprolegnia diclina VS20]EQC30795.1 hypothetical protein SDRG_11556 [Saprolegnia diclina VS20]|eukprot:XP_008615819.1 hypothetical protein SDRG_11556 [Saprolegnia diclina VS20]
MNVNTPQKSAKQHVRSIDETWNAMFRRICPNVELPDQVDDRLMVDSRGDDMENARPKVQKKTEYVNFVKVAMDDIKKKRSAQAQHDANSA